MGRVVMWSMVLAFGLGTGAEAHENGGSNGYTEAERIQRTRTEVRAATTTHADPAALRAGVARLEAALARLGEMNVHETAIGNDFLNGRRHDVRLDLARLYARLGDKENALTVLEAAQRVVWLPDGVVGLAKDPAFAALLEESRFKDILARARVAERIWLGPAASVPYKERLSVEERIAGLTQFWSEARAHFVYFDHVPDLDWDSVYLDYLKKVIAAKTTQDYYRVLMQLAPLLQDGHTNIYPPAQLAERFYARPPITTTLVEDKVMVLRVGSAQLASRVRTGDEIVAIDGVPVHRFAQERIAPFVSSSTPQDRQLRMYRNQLLAGDAKVPVTLTLRGATGQTRETLVARSGYKDIAPLAKAPFRMLAGDVAYVALDQFENDAGVKAFEAALPEIMAAKGLVIDVRENGGGSTHYGYRILEYLTALPIRETPQYVRSDNPYMRAQGPPAVVWVAARRSGAPTSTATRTQIYTGKVAVLTGARTFSAAEDFVLAFNSLKRGVTVGETTGGSTGQPLSLKLPGGGMARICIKRDLTPDERDFVGKGIAPDLQVAPTVGAVRSGRDPVLEQALAKLTEGR